MEPLGTAHRHHRPSPHLSRRRERARPRRQTRRHSFRRHLLEPAPAGAADSGARGFSRPAAHLPAERGRLRHLRRADHAPDPRFRSGLGPLQRRLPWWRDAGPDLRAGQRVHRVGDATGRGSGPRLRPRAHHASDRGGLDQGRHQSRRGSAARRGHAQHPSRRRPRSGHRPVERVVIRGAMSCAAESTCGCARPAVLRTPGRRTWRRRRGTCAVHPG